MKILDQLDEAEKAATPGPWCFDKQGDWVWKGTLDNVQACICEMRGFGAKLPMDENAELIALMRNNIRALIDIARAADEMRNNSAKAPIHAWVRLEEALAKLEGKK